MVNVNDQAAGSAQPSIEQARGAAAAAVTPDALAAELLAKRANGEKLSPAEYGKLGAFAKKAKSLFGFGGSPAQPAPAGAREPASMAAGASAENDPEGLGSPAPDSGICQRTTRAILSRIEAIAERKLTAAAQRANPAATTQTLARVRSAARLPADDKTLLIELSPDVAAELGVDPKKYCLVVFFGVIGLWGSEIWLAIDELKREAKEREAREAAAVRHTSETAAAGNAT